MFGIFEKLAELFQDLLLGIVQTNLEDMFTDINNKVNFAATEVGKTPSSWNAEVFGFIKNINDSVIIPIAGLIITAVFCIELINMVMEKNNMHSDTDTFEFFKYIFKMYVGVWLVSHAFTFTMAVFDVAQTLVNKAAGVVNTSAVLNSDQILAMVESLKVDKPSLGDLGGLVLISIETSLVSMGIQILAIIIFVVVYGRMIEICLYSSVAAIPFATMGNKEWGQIGHNFIKGLFALGIQGLFLIICLGIYAVLVKHIQVSGDIRTSVFEVLGYTVLLGLMLLKSGTLAKSIMNAH